MMASTGRTHASRVLIIVENLPVPFDRRVWQEATTLAAQGYAVSVICPTGKGHKLHREVIDGIQIYRHPLPLEANGAFGYAAEYFAALFWQTVLAWRVFLTRGFDIVHACNPPDTIFLVALPFKLLFRRAFVFDHHDLSPELYEAKFGRRDGFYRILCLLERLTFRFADAVIATNQSYREIAIDRGGKKPHEVTVVRSGPSLERIRIVPPDPKLRHGRRFLVGYVGVMGKQEGLIYLLEAARYARRELGRDDIHYVVVGSGPELDVLRGQARELGVEDLVEFTGFLPDDELLTVLNTADVCVNPDEFNEMNNLSTMNKIMEYMALAKPIVQFDMKEGRRSAADSSLYAKPNDPRDFAHKIVELLDDPDRRARMGASGRMRVEDTLAWRHEAPKLLALYSRLCRRREIAGLTVGSSPSQKTRRNGRA